MIDINKFTITEYEFGERQSNFLPNMDIYKYLKEEGVRKMVSEHYHLLVKSEAKHLFPEEGELLDGAIKRSADFFIQRLGGPEYFNMTRGTPRLADRHVPFKIDSQARKIWLDCYRQVLSKLEDVPEDLVLQFWKWLDEFSNWMRNTEDEPKYKINFSIKK